MTKIAMDCKNLMVKEISERLSNAEMLIVTNYKGLSSQDLNCLRRALRNISSEYVIVKDSMVKRALAEGANNRIVQFVEGETGIAIDKREDPTHVSKVLVKFSKDHAVLKIRGGIIKGSLISKEDIAILAALPSKEVLLGKLANVLNAPIQGLARVLNEIITKFVYALNAVKDKKTDKAIKEDAQTGPKIETHENKVDGQVQVEKKEENKAGDVTSEENKGQEAPQDIKRETEIKEQKNKAEGKEKKEE
ncbi:MAG: 50S ribosomal protein L10 [Candidatus Omnitrophota bacterium]